ncbi:hypothetical protein BU15DRAFT_60705 [Melanogaster broomeanus]|nr:hypothetical protein BU15DRAFT_60705 [Melanogaster broomeanus]
MEDLKQLLRELNEANGIDLLIHCTRGSRLCTASQNNYNLFYSAICRKKVPIAVVVTALEYYDGGMETWWGANEANLAALKMHFDAHACVTTLDAETVNSDIQRQRCLQSREPILSMIADMCSRDHNGAGQKSWLAAAMADVRAMVSPKRRSKPPPAPNLVIYDLSNHSQAHIGSSKNKIPFASCLMRVGKSLFNVYRIRDQQLLAGGQFERKITSRGADLLIFCASSDADLQESRRKVVSFYESYGGETRPLLVVVKGAETDEVAQEWWNQCNDGPGKVQGIVTALPPRTSARAKDAVVSIEKLIQKRTLQPAEIMETGYFGWLFGRWWFGRKRSSNLKPGSLAEEDALTASSVWRPSSSL